MCMDKTFFAFLSAATRTMLLERRSRARPTLLLLRLSVDDALLRWRPDLAVTAAAVEAAAAAGRTFLSVLCPTSSRPLADVDVAAISRLSLLAVFPCRPTTAINERQHSASISDSFSKVIIVFLVDENENKRKTKCQRCKCTLCPKKVVHQTHGDNCVNS